MRWSLLVTYAKVYHKFQGQHSDWHSPWQFTLNAEQPLGRQSWLWQTCWIQRLSTVTTRHAFRSVWPVVDLVPRLHLGISGCNCVCSCTLLDKSTWGFYTGTTCNCSPFPCLLNAKLWFAPINISVCGGKIITLMKWLTCFKAGWTMRR